jgi:hypothetical protein
MQTNFLTLILVMIGIYTLFAIINHFRSRANKPFIYDYLNDKGASHIVVSSVWFGGPLGNYVYDVEYTNRQGKRRRVQCKISARWLSDGTIYWSEPPEV